MSVAFQTTRDDRPAGAGELGFGASVQGYGMSTLLETAANAVRAATRRVRTSPGHLQPCEIDGHGPDALARVIEGEIIPRLLMAHRDEVPVHAAALNAELDRIPPGYAERFAAETLREEATTLMVRVEALIARGVTVETMFLHLLAPAARQLGVWWDEDSCDFVDVTMGLWRLQEIVHALAARSPGRAPTPGFDRRALFSPLPGEQHGFGTLLVEEFFRRSGWTTWSAAPTITPELIGLTAGRVFELVGLTVSLDRNIEMISGVIRAIRSTSRNPRLAIMVGGRVFSERPELAAQVGADGTAADGLSAVAVAEHLVTSMSGVSISAAAR